MPKPVSPLAVLVDDYLAHCRAAGLSPKTIRFSYGWPLQSVFLPWAERTGVDAVDQLTTRQLDRLSGELMDRKLAIATVWTYMKAVRRFLAWARAEGERVEAEAKLPKLPFKLVDILTPAEVKQLEDAAVSERDKLIIRTLAETGMRRAELAGLTIHDLTEQGGRWYLRVHGKGAHDRKVPITPALARRFQRFIKNRPEQDSDLVVTSLYRRPTGDYSPLTESGITQMVTALGQRARLSKRISPHTLRHTAATMMLRRGMNPLLVAQVLGHASLQMIQKVYSHLTPDDAHQALMDVLRVSDD